MTPDLIWIWFIIAGLLLGLEILTGTFFLLGLAASAAISGLVSLTSVSLNVQLGVFATLSILISIYISKTVRTKKEGFKSDVDQIFNVSSAIRAHSEATITYQGSPWTAVNSTQFNIESGARVRILKTEGVKLFIENADLSSKEKSSSSN